MPKLTEYYSHIDAMIYSIDTLLDAHEIKVLNLNSEDPDLEPQNWSNSIAKLQDSLNKLYVASAVHKFERVSKEQMMLLFRTFEEGTAGGKIIFDISYTITALDTPRLIEYKYNVPWLRIMEYNNITMSDFYPLRVIKIPIEVTIDSLASKDIPTFGDQSGNKILGTDLPNELAEDSTGDLQVLDEINSFQQTIDNMFLLEKGGQPFHEELGFDPKVSEEYNTDEQDAILQLRITNILNADNRVKNVTIQDSTKEGVTRKYNVLVEAITGEQITTEV